MSFISISEYLRYRLKLFRVQVYVSDVRTFPLSLSRSIVCCMKANNLQCSSVSLFITIVPLPSILITISSPRCFNAVGDNSIFIVVIFTLIICLIYIIPISIYNKYNRLLFCDYVNLAVEYHYAVYNYASDLYTYLYIYTFYNCA